MASTVLISRIDNLIQRTNEVKVCQDHFKFIGTGLSCLRNALTDNGGSYEHVDCILTAINEVIHSCGENETNLNGVTYQDLESILVRLHLRLAESQANMTDREHIKIEILNNTYYDLHSQTENVPYETTEQRLEVIEQLRLLREKHIIIIESYLRRCIELHKTAPPTDLTTDTVAKITHTFYQIPNEDLLQLQHNCQAFELPLTRTFTKLRSDKSTAFERNDLRRLASELNEDNPKSIWQQLVSTPYMQAIVGKTRNLQDENMNEEKIIRTKRWIVILGDPGSGKTSFSRWLVHHLAQTLLLNDQHSTDYGPLRIPILIRIGEFAEILKQQPSLTLFDYIGKHKWMGKDIIDDPSISLDHLSSALQDYIKQGQALIILDGLDEIPVSDLRLNIINIIEEFVETYVQIPTDGSAFDNAYLSRLLDDPSRSGGNQLIVTSRIVGYHTAPLAGQFAHYTIQPMNMEHMKDFVDYWFFHAHQQILDKLRFPSVNQGHNHGEALKQELDKPENIDLLDIASSPSLLSCICNMALHQVEGSPLPMQRIRLYEYIINSMLNMWSRKTSSIPRTKLIRMLSDIAFCIHRYSITNLISEDEVKDICFQSAKTFKSKIVLTSEDIEELEGQASEFARIIREDIGVLTIQDKSMYGFLHFSFQEYFTSLKLIEVDKFKQEKIVDQELSSDNEIQLVVKSLHRHSKTPRFRVPITLALAKISSSWSQKDFNDFCHGFIQEQDESNSLLPFGAFILIIFNNELVNYPSNDILFDALDRLMVAAARYKWSTVCPYLFDQIADALRRLGDDIVSLWIENFLTKSSSHDIQTISVLCHLLEGKPHEFENIKWLNQTSCSKLQSFSTHDNITNEFAIDRLLIKVAFSNHQLLPVNLNSLKSFLIEEDMQSNSIPITLLPLIITLYGGLKREGQIVVFDPSYIHRESSALTPILKPFLSIKDGTKQNQALQKLKRDLARTNHQDESSEAIDLFIATVCLNGIEHVQENIEHISNSILLMATNRFKYISTILRQLHYTSDENDCSIENETTKFISIAVDKFQYTESARVQFLDLLDSLKSSVARLRYSTTSTLLEGQSRPNHRLTLYLPDSLRMEGKLLNGLLSTDTRFSSDHNSCSLLNHFKKLFWILEQNDDLETQNRTLLAIDKVPEYLVFRNDEDILSILTFIPSHLQNLYIRLLKQKFIIINSNEMNGNDRPHLYFGHILTECLILLSNASCKGLTILSVLITLLPWLRMQQLEIFGGSLLWALAIKDSHYMGIFESKRKRPINYETGRYLDKDENIFAGHDIVDEQRRARIRKNIEKQYQRLQTALSKTDGKDMKLYSASVSLAHVCRWSEDERRVSLLNESVERAMSITNNIARIDALCVIALYSCTDYDKIQISTGKSIRDEIEQQFKDVYPTLPLLLHTAIFIRCLPLLQNRPMIDQCLQNLFKKFDDNDQRDQQAATEALSPYLQSNTAIVSESRSLLVHNTSSVLKKYFNIGADQSLSSSVMISNLQIMELTKDCHKCIKTDVHQLGMDESILTEVQVLTITDMLSSTCLTDQSKHSEQLADLNNALHRVSLVEFKARYLVESWMKLKDSNELFPFAYHAALLLTNSDLWSVDAAKILCDLLCCENDRFRQRAELICRSSNDNDIRTSSKLGIDVLLTLLKKKTHYQVTSASAKLTLGRFLGNITLDVQWHLETFLWLERYRIHVLFNKEYLLNGGKFCGNSYVADYLSDNPIINACPAVNIFKLSGDLILYMCDMIACNFFLFLDIDGDTTSTGVIQSHSHFVVSVLVTLNNLLNNTDEMRTVANEALMKLFDESDNDDVRRAVAYALGYVCNGGTYKGLFEKIQMVSNNGNNETSNYSDNVLAALISSYSYCICINKITFDTDDMDLFSNLSNHSSEIVLKAVHTGYGRVLNDKSFLLEMLSSDCIQCYRALIGATAHMFLYEAQANSEHAIAEFIEENSFFLPIFINELYRSIRQYTENVSSGGGTDFDLAYGYPQFVRAASLVALRIPEAFCTYVRDWVDGDKLKRALFYTSKQHNFPQRASCIIILSTFGELTVELCEMFIEALHDDSYIQNTSYQCLTHINSIKDETAVLNMLLLYLKSKSMNVRYIAVKILLHLTKYSLTPFEQFQTTLNSVMQDPDSNEDLFLVEEQDDMYAHCEYYYVGSLKDAIYSLIIQYWTGDTSESFQRNNLNDIDSNFFESEKAARLASCLYETKNEVLDVPLDGSVSN